MDKKMDACFRRNDKTMFHQQQLSGGSALILAVVLTSLLAIIGTVFIMTARVDNMATSAISSDKALDLAVDTVIERLGRRLSVDESYYDYPDDQNPWLAGLEPYTEDGTTYKWRQISDLTGYLRSNGFQTQGVDVEPVGLGNLRKYVPEYPELRVDESGAFIDGNGNRLDDGVSADADGDGIADSKWIELEGSFNEKPHRMFAAVRIIDNCGMINVNTAYMFDENGPEDKIDGSSVTQIDLVGLSERGNNGTREDASQELRQFRKGKETDDSIGQYEQNVVLRYDHPDANYTPFDVSDELELRNRFLLNNPDINTRIEQLWTGSFVTITSLEVPVGSPTSGSNLEGWFYRTQDDMFDLNELEDKYSYRHIATTYSVDTIKTPAGQKMINVNKATDPNSLYQLLAKSAEDLIAPLTVPQELPSDVTEQLAQFSVNLVDFADSDPGVSILNVDGNTYYGFEIQPFITEIAIHLLESGPSYFAVELCNPFNVPLSLDDYEIELMAGDVAAASISLEDDQIPASGFLVVVNNITHWSGDIDGVLSGDPPRTIVKEDLRLRLLEGSFPGEGIPPRAGPDGGEGEPPVPGGSSGAYSLSLRRKVLVPDSPEESWIYLDRQDIDYGLVTPNEKHFFFRDIADWHIVYQNMVHSDASHLGSLAAYQPDRSGHNFSFVLPNSRNLTSVADISKILTVGPGETVRKTIGEQLTNTNSGDEYRIRLDLARDLSNVFDKTNYYRGLLRYLTVFDPSADNIDNDGDGSIDELDSSKTPENRIHGRVNINTAPWYVIARLPWVSDELAKAIVAYRDKVQLENGVVDYSDDFNGRARGIWNLGTVSPPILVREERGFADVVELLNVTHDLAEAGGNSYDASYDIREYGRDNFDQNRFPDLTPGDGVADDLEERDLIFARISNLVTVRSDVFTAYILVRLGTDGPQRRVVAILDRSETPAGKVRIIARCPVPDPQ